MKPEQLRNRILAADLAWIPVALAAEQGLCSGLHCSQLPLGPSNFVVYVVCTVFAWVLLSENLHLDGFRGGWRLPALVSHLLLAVALLMVLLLAVENVSERYVGRMTLSVFTLFLLVGFLCIRWFGAAHGLAALQEWGCPSRCDPGFRPSGHGIGGQIRPPSRTLVPGDRVFMPGNRRPQRDTAETPTQPRPPFPPWKSSACCGGYNVDELVMAHTPASNEILNLVALCRQQAIRVSLVPQPYELYLSRPSLLDLGGLPLLQFGELSRPLRRESANAFWIWLWALF